MPVNSEISSRQLMEEIITRSALIFTQQIKDGNKGNDNQMLRDLKQIHGHTATADLPEHLQKIIPELVASMFGYINSKGYVLVPKENIKR